MSISLLPPSELTPPAVIRPVLYTIKDKQQLYSFFMPYLKNGGLFIATPAGSAPLPPGSKVSILLTLPDDPAKKTITGRICWLTHAGAGMGSLPGMGVHFDENEQNKLVVDQIEKMLAGFAKTDTRTQTL